MTIYSSEIWPKDDGDCDLPGLGYPLSMAGEQAARDATRAFWKAEEAAQAYVDDTMGEPWWEQDIRDAQAKQEVRAAYNNALAEWIEHQEGPVPAWEDFQDATNA